ncbi:VOC family protein [Streptomyces sp. A7024]|uniref:VOC family protein n=1 Tax=Streptomyces coryli TaxID=1128680 RepID=A0A6G4TZW8_9ACTN|nr:VOC family protein [Streptomyces coryli]NGN65373.1 VOC family protein [Streptomyces coryli]
MPIATLGPVALDCPDPRALAEFYAGILGGEVKQNADAPDWIDLNLPTGERLAFQEAPDFVPPSWPNPERPQQFHLDLMVPRAELDAAQEQVLALGAKLLDDQIGKGLWRVYADPAGHPFCLCVS